MSVASATMGDGRVVSQAEERKVIFASSLGTVFEWYDFYLYATLAPFFAALFFPPGMRRRRCFRASAPTPRASWSARSARCVRASRRPRRPQVHLPGHHPVHGRLDLRGRPAADLRGDRLARARSCWSRCACFRAWRWAANMAARRPMSPSMRRAAARLCHELDPDHGDPRLLPVARGHRDLPHCRWTPRRSPNGAGACRSWSR